MKKQIKFCLMSYFLGNHEMNKNLHPQHVMEDLGISYEKCVGHSIGECWIFYNCENLPEDLPIYITIMELSPLDHIGFGLSKKDAEKLDRSLKNETV